MAVYGESRRSRNDVYAWWCALRVHKGPWHDSSTGAQSSIATQTKTNLSRSTCPERAGRVQHRGTANVRSTLA